MCVCRGGVLPLLFLFRLIREYVGTAQSLWTPRQSGPEWTLWKKHPRQEEEPGSPWLMRKRGIVFSWPPLLLPQALAAVLNADGRDSGRSCLWLVIFASAAVIVSKVFVCLMQDIDVDRW